MELQPIFNKDILGNQPFIIAGPCSAETKRQTLDTACRLAENGIRLFRAGIWKPRTKPGCFEGIGTEGLKWLQKVKQQTGMLVSTEVATPQHVRQALDYGLDFIWIGARTTSNPFAVQEIADSLAGHDIPVLVKNPISPDIALWTGAIERLYNAGIKRLGAIHRGFTSYNRHLYRNTPYWEIPIELKMQMPQLTMICDPSHIGGKRELVADLCIQAMELRFNGLIIESHINPDEAWSDAGQQITPDELKYIISHITEKNSKTVDKDINSLRTQIDECDEALVELLAKRMQLAKEIGAFKKHNNMSVLQQDRYNEILKKRMAQAENLSLDKDFIKKIFQTIHTASVNEQIKLK